MRRSGDVQPAHLGTSAGREAGFARPVVIVTAQRILDHDPSVVHVVPLTTTVRGLRAEITLTPDAHNGLRTVSAAQCQHVRAVAVERLGVPTGNVGAEPLALMREIIADLLDL